MGDKAMTTAAPADSGVLLEFMFRLGQAYLACSEQTAEVELLLRRVALAYGMGRTRVVVLPTEAGMAAYQAYWKALDAKGRKALEKHHAELKAIATDADAVPQS